MRTIRCLHLITLALLLGSPFLLGGGLPPAAQALADTFIENPASRFAGAHEAIHPPEEAFSRLRKIYEAAGEEAVAALESTESPTLAEELALIGRALSREPKRVVDLQEVYGKSKPRPPRAPGTPMPMVVLPNFAPLQNEHAAAGYRLFWEAWLLVDHRTKWNPGMLLTAGEALRHIRNDRSLVVLQHYLDCYLKEIPLALALSHDKRRILESRNNDEQVRILFMNEHIGGAQMELRWIFNTVGSFGSSPAIRFLLSNNDKAINAVLESPECNAGSPEFRAFCGRRMDMRKDVSQALAARPFTEVGLRNKPVIEAELKRTDLPAAHREILAEALRIIHERETGKKP